jgi:hypothetical protein
MTTKKARAPRGAQAARIVARSVRDRKFVAWSLALPLAVLVALVHLVSPDGTGSPTYQVVVLCLILAAVAGRALLGQEEVTPAPDPAWARYGGLAVFVAALLAHLPGLWVGFLSDDFGLVSMVSHLPSAWAVLTMPPDVLYRPFHFVVWWAEQRAWGGTAIGYHAVNLALHAANAVLVYLLGRRLTGSLTAGLVGGLLFALHPLHTEVVVWASCQPDLQATLLALLSLLSLEGYLHGTRARGPYLVGALLAFAAALWTKESVLSFPAIAAAWVWLRAENRRWRGVGLVTLWYGLVLAGYLCLRLSSMKGFGGYTGVTQWWNTVFPSAPMRLAYSFFFPLGHSVLGGSGVPGAVLLAAALFSVAAWWCVTRLPAVPARRLLFYLGFLLFASIPVWKLPAPSADLEYGRLAYLPTLALAWLIGEVCAAKAWEGSRGRRTVGGVLAVCGALSLWYTAPFLQAHRTTEAVLKAGRDMVAEAPASVADPVFYVEGLPEVVSGVQVFRNGFAVALAPGLTRPALIQTVSAGGDMPREALTLVGLQPGEYLYRWDGKARRMVQERPGDTPDGGRGGRP